MTIAGLVVKYNLHLLISFREGESSVFNPVRKRIANTRWRARKLGSDYLAYALIDAVVDGYFVALENIGEQIEQLEENLLYRPDEVTLQQIHNHKSNVYHFRRTVWPLRDAVSVLLRGDAPMIAESTNIYLRDLADHVVQAVELIDSFRDLLNSLFDAYLSTVGQKTNDVMRVLTIIATIFIPLTFIVGIYGMNFRNMPELEWKIGYFLVIGVMVLLAVGMVLLFRRKRWL